MPKLKEVLEEKFMCQSRFSSAIEKLGCEHKEMNYIDAIIFFCDQNNIDVESVSKLISKPLKEKLKFEAIELNFLKKTSYAKLPL